MTIIEVNHTKDIPSKPMRMYVICKGDTVEDCATLYKRHYGTDPVKGYKYADKYLYFELPGGEG